MKKIDEIGNRYGGLIVLGESSETYKGRFKWDCQCDCGRIVSVVGAMLRNGNTTSCGCVYRNGRRKEYHGMVGTRMYRIWAGMKTRCTNKTRADYKNYGGRGIKFCEEWLYFLPFKEWAENNGYSDELEIDRIDVNGDYCPSNCRFVTRGQNVHNIGSTGKSSKYKGVGLHKGRWIARCKGINIGSFGTEIEAASAYNEKAAELYGEYAHLNVFNDFRKLVKSDDSGL